MTLQEQYYKAMSALSRGDYDPAITTAEEHGLQSQIAGGRENAAKVYPQQTPLKILRSAVIKENQLTVFG